MRDSCSWHFLKGSQFCVKIPGLLLERFKRYGQTIGATDLNFFHKIKQVFFYQNGPFWENYPKITIRQNVFSFKINELKCGLQLWGGGRHESGTIFQLGPLGGGVHPPWDHHTKYPAFFKPISVNYVGRYGILVWYLSSYIKVSQIFFNILVILLSWNLKQC